MAAARTSLPWINVIVVGIVLVVPFVWRHPIGGMGAVFIGSGLGLYFMSRGARKLNELRRTRLAHDEPIPIASAQPGMLATVSGKISSPLTAISPTTGDAFALIVATCHRTSNVDANRTLLVSRALGTDLRIEDGSGEARITLGAVRLYGRIHQTVSWTGWGLDAVSDDGVRAWIQSTGAKLTKTDRDVSPYYLYQEVVLGENDSVTVTGEVTSVEEHTVPTEGYRGSSVRVHVTVGGEGAVETAIRGFSPEGLARLDQSARRTLAGGVLLTLWGVSALGAAFVAPS